MLLSDQDGVIWLDGKMVPWREANVHVTTHTLHYGMGVFEGIRAYKTDKGTAVFRLKEHVDRLFDSAKIMNLAMPFDRETVNRACIACVKENKMEAAYIRPVVFLGSESLSVHSFDLSVRVAIMVMKWGAYCGPEALTKGIAVRTSSHTRYHANTTFGKAKAVGNYINSFLALREAKEFGAEEALLLDTEGCVAEGSGENIFIVHGGEIYTPDTSSALEGITRETIMTLAAEEGFKVHERRLTREDIYTADEAFFTGTAAEVTAIRELDKRTIGSGRMGPVTGRLQKTFFDQTQGRRAAHPDWLTYV